MGGIIDNSGLNDAIKHDMAPDQYTLKIPDYEELNKFMQGHNSGTIIYFEELNQGIYNRVDYIKKLVALYFRFSLIDEAFSIYVNDEKITIDHLSDLADKTQILWVINDLDDPYVTKKLLSNKNLLLLRTFRQRLRFKDLLLR